MLLKLILVHPSCSVLDNHIPLHPQNLSKQTFSGSLGSRRCTLLIRPHLAHGHARKCFMSPMFNNAIL